MHWIAQLRDGMLNQQRATAIELRLAEVDEEIAALAADAYMTDVDRLLDERMHLVQYLCALRAGLIPNG